ncbi:hypothetical protein, partial [Alistipes sp. ZOR0009]|uniref:hypothetical protein n=1 Tax=Alistipes sp. ZOR0009 TaxID=1339253 RepID=UPI0006467BAF
SRRCELIFALFFVLLFCAKKVAGRNLLNAVATTHGCALLFCYFWMDRYLARSKSQPSTKCEFSEAKLRPASCADVGYGERGR